VVFSTYQDRDADRAAEAITLIAERLADPARVAEVISGEFHEGAGLTTSAPLAVSHGLASAATLYAELAHFDQRWLAVADQHVRAAVKLLPTTGRYAMVALLLAIQSCPDGYARLRRGFASALASYVHDRIAYFRSRQLSGVSWDEYDLVAGLSRPLRALLAAASDPLGTSVEAESAVRATLRHFIRLSEPIQVEGHEIPGWWVPPGLQHNQRRFPRGNFNLGLAHGAAAPLSLLCLALKQGWEIEGQRDAIWRYADWLSSRASRDETGISWRGWVTWEEEVAGAEPATAIIRTAWCYGAAGVAHALYLAGTALDVARWREQALGSLHDVLNRDESAWRLDGPTLCHGYAGLLQVLWRVGLDSGDPLLLAGCVRVARSLLDFASPSHVFVVPHLERDPLHPQPADACCQIRHRAGIRAGAAGVACALLSVTPSSLLVPGASVPELTAAQRWDRCLGLS